MSRTKTKRILWTIAALVVLSFVAALLLHEHDKPRIIGKLSREEAAEISKIASKFERDKATEALTAYLKNRDAGSIVAEIKYYLRTKVLSIEPVSSFEAVIAVETGTNKIITEYYVVKNGSGWKVAPWVNTNSLSRPNIPISHNWPIPPSDH